MKKLTILLLALLLPILSVAQASIPQKESAEDLYKKGKNYYDKEDYKDALEWFEKAAKQGHSDAQWFLGYMYDKGKGVKQNYSKAAKWYEKAGDQGHTTAQWTLGYFYYCGWGVPKDPVKSFEWYLKAANNGLALAQWEIGCKYKYGNGVSKDYAKAVEWFRKAADQGFADGQKSLAYMYEDGLGVTQDYDQALFWLKKAANKGDIEAKKNLDLINQKISSTKNSVTQNKTATKKANNSSTTSSTSKTLTADENFKKGEEYYKNMEYSNALPYIRKAAEDGHSNAQFRLGYMYDAAQGVAKDYAEAAKWYRKAAEQGHVTAQNNLGSLYRRGLGVTQDYAEALKWFNKSASQNSTIAKYAMKNLGLMYENGQGVARDYKKAEQWYKKALERDPNYTDAKNSLTAIQSKMADQNKSIAQNNTNKSQTITNNNNTQKSVANNNTQKSTTIDNTQKTATTNGNTQQQQTTTTIIVSDVDKDIPLTTVKNPNILAVVIGNEKYSKLSDVPYAENDAKMFKEYCEKTLGVTKEHIKYLPNAGFVDIYDAVEWLKKGTDSYSGEASVIFYYAGHGLPDPTTGSQYLLPADVDGKNLNLTVSLQKLYDEFGQMPARSVAVFLDACFSGTNRDNQMVAANKGARLALTKSKKGNLSGKTIVFSATEEDQTAHPFTDQKHGFFTYFLLRKLQESKGNATLGEIADYVTKSVKRAVFDKIQVSQTPSVSSPRNFGNDWRQMKLK